MRLGWVQANNKIDDAAKELVPARASEIHNKIGPRRASLGYVVVALVTPPVSDYNLLNLDLVQYMLADRPVYRTQGL